MAEHIINNLARRYPQLTLPISDETRHSERYRNIVLCTDVHNTSNKYESIRGIYSRPTK